MMQRLVWLLIFIVVPSILRADQQALNLLKKMDELYRSDNSEAIMEMRIETNHWKRTLKMETWSEGMENTFIRVLSPKKDRGVATLKLGNEMWNYFPKINKVIKVPPSMMMGSWMGSDFTNDDLVREVSLVKEYNVNKEDLGEYYKLILLPKEETVTIWSKIEFTLEKQSLLPIEERYYNEKGEKVRTLYFTGVREFSGKRLPATMTMVPHFKEGHKTVVQYIELTLDMALDENIFTLRNLKKRF